MLDVIKAILDALKLVPLSEISSRHREEKVAVIGLQLFDLYSNAVQIAENGTRIIEGLDYLVRRHKYFFESNASDSTIKAAFRLRPLLERQLRCVRDFLSLAGRLNEFANIVDQSSDRQFDTMHKAIVEKTLWLWLLDMEEDIKIDFKVGHVVMGRPFGYISAELDQWIHLHNSNPNRIADSEDVFVEINYSDIYPSVAKILNSIRAGVTNAVPWDRDTNSLIEGYLASGVPKRRLEMIGDAARSFKDSIQKNFKLDEILLAAEKRHRARQI
ncbi:MAG: hypothetical protein HY244_14125 [Rhizobiales bacterium]|nr:hypothetical protein [Hyphomicrobiales bacterium]